MRLTRTLGMAGALILAALVGGTLIGSALARDDEPDGNVGALCDTFLDAFAAELGSTRDEVVAAGKAAASAALDAAVASGDLSERRAEGLRERIEAYDGTGCDVAGLWRHGRGDGAGRGLGAGVGMRAIREAAATALGIDGEELNARLRDAGSLEALATEEGVDYSTVKSAILADVEADLDAAVADGRLSQERADRVLQRLTTWLDEGGELGARGRGPGPWGGWGD